MNQLKAFVLIRRDSVIDKIFFGHNFTQFTCVSVLFIPKIKGYNIETGFISWIWAALSVLLVLLLVRRIRSGSKIYNEENKLYRSILCNNGYAIVTTNSKGRITGLNGAAEVLSGWSEPEAINKNISEVFPEKKDAESALVTRILNDNLTSAFSDAILISKNGSEYYVRKSGTSIRNKSGKIIGSMLIFKSRLVETAENMYPSEKNRWLNAAEKLALIGHFERDLSSEVIFLSETMQYIYGVSEACLDFKIIDSFTLPDYRSLKEKAFHNLLENQQTYDIEFKIARKSDGQIRYIHSIAEYDKSRNVIFGMVQDITERKKTEIALRQSEERYRLTFFTNPDSINVNRLEDGLYMEVNEGFTRLTGYSRDEVIGKTSLEIDIWCDLSDRMKLVAGLKDKGYYDNLEARFRRKNGTEGTGLMSAKLLLLDDVPYILSITRDISERKIMEDQVREARKIAEENEKRLQEAERVARIGNFEINLTKHKATWSEQTFRIFGLNPAMDREPETEEAYIENIVEEDRNAYKEAYAKCLNVSGNFDLVYRIYSSNREIKFVHSIAHVIRDENDLPSRLFGTLQDITEQKQKETALLESENKYRLIAENSSDGIVVIGADTKVKYVSPGYLKMMSAKEEEVLGIDSTAIYNFIHPDDRDKVFELVYSAIADKRKELCHTYRVKTKNGKYMWREDHFNFHYNNQGDYIDTCMICMDVTEKKISELAIRKFKKAIESSQVSIIITDTDGNIEYVNPYFSQLTGYSLQESIGKNPKILKTRLHPQEFYQSLWQTIKSGRTWEGEFYNRKKNGQFFWENAIISPITNENKEITSFVAIKTDISENKRILEELYEAKIKAEESDKLKTAFLNNISHEIRTPLNAIVGFSQLLVKERVSEHRQIFSDNIDKSCNRLIEVVSDVIEISQIHANQIKLYEKRVNFPNFFEGLKASYLQKISGKKLKLEFKINLYGKYLCSIADSNKLQKIFDHLLSNAIKFTSEGSVKVNARIRGESYEFEVSDTGIGIIPEMQQKVFEPFRQIEIELKRNFSGNGVGLSIVKAYVELLGGKIWLNSKVGKGTSVYFTIPYKPASEIKETVPNRSSLDNKTILIVDDEEDIHYLIGEYLKAQKCKVVSAINGIEAIDICRQQPVDLILMDIKMPEMDGVTTTKLIKEINPGLPVVALTAYSNESDTESFLENGFNDCLSKPFHQGDIIEMVSRHIAE